MKEYYWHVHHDTLMELLTHPVADRINFIERCKPKSEVALRLRLLKPVRGKLPVAVIRAWEACDKAKEAYNEAKGAYHEAWEASDKTWEAYDKAWEASDKAWGAYDEAWKTYGKAWEASKNAIEKLHRAECPNCPWDGKTIFSEKA